MKTLYGFKQWFCGEIINAIKVLFQLKRLAKKTRNNSLKEKESKEEIELGALNKPQMDYYANLGLPYHREETIWTRQEKVLFWEIIKGHVLSLLFDATLLQQTAVEVDIDFSAMDPSSQKNFLQCQAIVRSYLWCGEYRTAICYHQVVMEFFYLSFGRQLGKNDEIKLIESIFLNS